MALYELLSSVMTCVDDKIPVCAIYTDLTKALDYVDHNILKKKTA